MFFSEAGVLLFDVCITTLHSCSAHTGTVPCEVYDNNPALSQNKAGLFVNKARVLHNNPRLLAVNQGLGNYPLSFIIYQLDLLKKGR